MIKMKRAFQLDFHTMPGIKNFGQDWDANLFAKTLKEAHIDYLNAAAQCNLGFCYYPTKIGVPYPEMKGDMFGSLREACRKEDIKVIAYISTGLNHEQSRRNPQWCQVDDQGRIIWGDKTANFFRTVCYNTGYREHIISEILEVLTTYDVDGLFLDSVVVRPCWCPRCMEKMSLQGLDNSNADEVLKFAWETTMQFARDIRAILPAGKSLRFNGLPEQAVSNLNTHGEIECLPGGGWGYDYFGAAVAYVRNLYEHTIYMTGRFQASWGDFGGFKTKASIENDFYDALCNNAQISLGDHLHPTGKLENVVCQTIGSIYERFEKYEKWTDNAKYLPEIGVVCNNSCYNGRYALPSQYNGISRMLGELKYNFDIINEDMDFERFTLLILPDELEMTVKLSHKIKTFLDNGKKVISSGIAGLNQQKNGFALKEWDFLTFHGVDYSKTAYYKNLFLKGDEREMRWAMYEDGIFIKAVQDTTAIAQYVKPYFDRHWDGMHGYYYTPPEKDTNYAAVVMSNNVAHISFKIFKAYFEHASKFHKDMLKEILNIFLLTPLIKAEKLPSTARVTVTGTDNYRLLHIKLTHPEPRGMVSIIEEHDILPEGYWIAVRGKYQAVKRLPEEYVLETKIMDDYTYIKLPQIIGYDMFLLEMHTF